MPSSLAAYVPTPAVTVDGQTPDGFGELVLGVLAEEGMDGLARCELRLDAWGLDGGEPGYLWFDRRMIDFGAEIEVQLGPPDELGLVFSGRVTAFEGSFPDDAGATLVLLAEDKLQDLRMTRRTRTFTDSSAADVIGQIAGDHGLTPDVDLDGPSHRQLTQLNQSDLAFVRDLARPLGADVWLDGTTLHVAHPDDQEPIVLRYGSELLSLSVIADLAHQCTEQRVGGWDVAGKEAVLESADGSALGAELDGGTSASDLLRDAFGERPTTTVLAAATTTAEARALAKGLYLERARRFVSGTAVADGIPLLRCGRSVAISGVGPMFDGTYELARVTHRFDRGGGYRSELEVQRPGVPR